MTQTKTSDVDLPRAAKRPIERTHHGDTFVDNYDWLRDKDSPDTRAYLESENAYADAQMAHLADLRESIFGEIKSRTQETDLSVPSRRGGYWYYRRTEEGQQYPIVCRTKAVDDDWTPPVLEPGVDIVDEDVLLDCNELADGKAFFSLGAFTVSLDENLLAYSTDVVGDERYTVRVKDLRTGDLLPDEIPNTLHSVTWSANGTHLFYTTVNDAWRPDKVWRHELGTAAVDDVTVHTETDDKFGVGIERSTSDRYLILSVGSKITSEARILEADDPTGDFRVVIPRVEGVEYDVDHAVIGQQDRLVVLHNRDALNFTLGIGPVTLASIDELETVIPHDDAVRLSGVTVSATTMAVNLRQNSLPQVRVFPIDADGLGEGANIAFEEELFEATATGFGDWQQPFVRLSYGSFVTPASVYEYDPKTGDLHLRKQQPVLGGYDPADYVQTREWVTARDGARIPVSIVRHKTVAAHSSAPVLLYGYGSYEISYDPFMSIARLSLLDRGMVYVLAHVRGGGELGRSWYEQGKLLHKKNTFTDYIDGCPAPGRHRLDHNPSAGRNGRQRRWPADGCRGQPGAGPVRWHRGPGALRRRVDDDPGPLAPAERHRVGRVGRPAARPGGVRVHEVLHAVREHPAARLSGHLRPHLHQRHAGVLRRAGQVGGAPARDAARLQPGPLQVRDVGRPRRSKWPLRRLARASGVLRVDPGHGRGGPRSRGVNHLRTAQVRGV